MDVDGRVRELEHYVYANGVLSDYDHEAKLTRRQLVQDGELRDPLRLGEGPIPIPIGQRRWTFSSRSPYTRRRTRRGNW